MKPAAASPHARAFTLVELLLSTTVLAILMLVTMTALESMQNSWRQTKSKVNQFREARIAFETITRNLSQATLNTYWDYYYTATKSNIPPAGTSAPPAGYVRQSELDFRVLPAKEVAGSAATSAEYPGHSLFFQAPLGLSQDYRGLPDLLNARGYYVRFASNESRRPGFLPGRVVPVRHRWQLMEYRPPAEQTTSDGTPRAGNSVYTNATWYSQNLATSSRPIADNILLLLISPQVPQETIPQAQAPGVAKAPTWIAPGYRYSSRDADNSTPVLDDVVVNLNGTLSQGTRHLLPPQVQVTLVAADEPSISRWRASAPAEAVDILAEANAPFAEAVHYQRDLERLNTYLTAQRLNYRVFSTMVTLRNAAWDSTTY